MKLAIPAGIRQHEGLTLALVGGGAAVVVVLHKVQASNATAAAAAAAPAIPADVLPASGAGGGGGGASGSVDTSTASTGSSFPSLGDITAAVLAALPTAQAPTPTAAGPSTSSGGDYQAPIGGTQGASNQVPGSGPGSANASPGVVAPIPQTGPAPTTPGVLYEASPGATYPTIGASNTAAANDALDAALVAAGVAQPKSGYLAVDSGKLASAPPALQAAYATATGQPAAGVGLTPTGQPAGSMGSFTGVVGTSGPAGMVYNVYRNGQLVAAAPGSPTTDTVALAAKYGVKF